MNSAVQEISPSPVQKVCIDYITNPTSRSVLLTAEAGSGKTTVVNWCIEKMAESGLSVIATAFSAVAANRLIGGKTIHRAFGIRPKWKTDTCIANSTEELSSSIRTCDVLFIDECSMVPLSLLNAVDEICRFYRASHSALGGIKVIFVGDFAQLPPVAIAPVTSISQSLLTDSTGKGFRKYFSKVVFLPCNFRQLASNPKPIESETTLLSILRNIRAGAPTESDLSRLRSRILSKRDFAVRIESIRDSIRDYTHPIYITSTHESARRFNEDVIKGFDAPTTTYVSPKSDRGVVLCKGCRVIFLVNKKFYGIFNGSLGTVLECRSHSVFVQFDDLSAPEEIYDRESVGTKICLPLLPLYALTIHKSQGMTIEGDLLCNLSGLFEMGQGYTALSRCKSLENLFLVDDFDERKISMVNPTAVRIYATIQELHQSSGRLVFGKKELGLVQTPQVSISSAAATAASSTKPPKSSLLGRKKLSKTASHKKLLSLIEEAMNDFEEKYFAERANYE